VKTTANDGVNPLPSFGLVQLALNLATILLRFPPGSPPG
jgi:hypothetical protein